MCASEVSGIEWSVWRTYQDQGLRVWAIGAPDVGSEREEAIRDFASDLGLSMPVLLDWGGEVTSRWPAPPGTEGTEAPYPQEWLIDRDGMVAWYNNTFDYGELVEVIEAELDDPP